IFENINFDLHKGEILGMFGLVGSGRTDIVSAIFGATEITGGEIEVFGKKERIRKPRDAIKLGIGLLPENRRTQGLALPLSVKINTNVAIYAMISKFGLINHKTEKSNANRYVREMATKTPSIETAVRTLSGGNQQKVVIGKWLACKSKIMIFDEPTVGVDVGSKSEIYKLLEKLTKSGNSIIFISSYLPEVIGVSDRILVISEGKQMGIVERARATEERILKLASGIAEFSHNAISEVV
ncbi:MAG: ATP-binding cassette domain-containing protein, partial [Spirochaetales bacterium]